MSQNQSVRTVTSVCFLLSLVLVVILCACGTASTNSTSPSPPPSPSVAAVPSDTPTPTPNSSPVSPLDAIAAVLRGDTEFCSTDAGKNLNMSQLSQAVSTDNSVVTKVDKFTVIDLDHDGTPEVVLWLNVNGNDSYGYEVLRYQDNVVYGYTLWYRQFEGLKTDGTFIGSSGAADNAICTITFTQDAYTDDQITYSQSSTDADGNFTVSCFVNRQSSTQDAFNAIMDQQNAKQDVTWYDFTANSIAVMPSPAPCNVTPPSTAPSSTFVSTPAPSATPTPDALSAAQQAYLQILADNEAGIKGFEQTFNCANNVAVSDICGDSMPELIFLTDPDPTYNGAHTTGLYIYSMINGQAIQILKETDILDQESGCDFALAELAFRGGGFSIMRSQSGGDTMAWNESVSLYAALTGNQLFVSDTLSYDVTPLNYSAGTHTDTCTENGSSISLASYQSKCADFVNNIQNILICYGYTEVNTNSIDNFAGIGTILDAKVASTPPLAMSYDEIKAQLSS